MQKAPYKLPAKGSDAVEILMNDHRLIEGLLERLTSAVDNAERKSALEELKAVLTIHNATEENLVYPAIERIARKRAEAQHLYHETAEADVVVFELDSMLKEGRGEEDAFAVTAAEVCATCTADLTDIDEPDFNDVECPVNNPEAACNNGQCTVVAVPPPCEPDRVCEADEFCDISNVSVACPGPAYYVAVSGSGACTASDTDLGSSCQSADDCNAGESCLGANGFNEGTCGCGDAADRPTFCENGCEILSDENDCNFCYCPNGCPDGG